MTPQELQERKDNLKAHIDLQKFDLDEWIASCRLIAHKYQNKANEVLSDEQYIKIPPRVRQRIEKI